MTFKVEGVTLGYRRDVMLDTLRQVREIAKSYEGLPGRKSMLLFAGYWVYSETPGSTYGDMRFRIRRDLGVSSYCQYRRVPYGPASCGNGSRTKHPSW